LTWGATPSDLDAHLTGPLSDGTRFHVYWDNKVVTGANLDIDDISSYGPETITITNQIAGLYRFSVHDFSNELLTSSSALSQSGAQVRVYRGSTLIATYNVPQNIPGTLWTVFELNGTTITTVNSMTYAGHSGDVTKVSLVGEDPALFRGLPSKRQSLQISR
jgi:uncharacterized protein YfaP (DUF2135 family)